MIEEIGEASREALKKVSQACFERFLKHQHVPDDWDDLDDNVRDCLMFIWFALADAEQALTPFKADMGRNINYDQALATIEAIRSMLIVLRLADHARKS